MLLRLVVSLSSKQPLHLYSYFLLLYPSNNGANLIVFGSCY
ncbi:unnamed protein product [Arabidopsis halleri]